MRALPVGCINANVGRTAQKNRYAYLQQAPGVSHFCYNQTMTIGITGPERQAPRRNVVVALLTAAIAAAISLILLGLTGAILVNWMWFSAIGYLNVFWITIGAKAGVFFTVFAATALIIWANAWLALNLARQRVQYHADFKRKLAATATPSDLLEFLRDRLPWPLAIAVGAGLVALLVAAGEVSNWSVFLQFLYGVPYGANDPLFDKDIGFYLFSLPAYIAVKNWMLLTLFISALFTGLIYWAHGDIEYQARQRSMSPTSIAHGSVLLGSVFFVKAWSYSLDRYLLLKSRD